MMRTVSVAVTTPTRFHHFELARELARHHCLEVVNTGFPRVLSRTSGVAPRLIRPFPWLQTPLAVANRFKFVPRRLGERLRRIAWTALDSHVARNLSACDVYVAHTGAGLAAGRAVRSRGGVYICDTGTAHVRVHERILRAEHDRLGLEPPAFERQLFERELAEYEAADAITVPSKFVLDSFVSEGCPRNKLHLLPYGVDLDVYKRTKDRVGEFRVLFVGALSVQKGLHYLLEAFTRARIPNSRLVLVGAVEPETPVLLARTPSRDIELTGPLARADVVDEMSRASVLVLPSIHDGFGLVVGEALACGCPVIASNQSGGPELIDEGVEGFIVPVSDADAIANRLKRLAASRVLVERMSAAAVERMRRLGGWATYGRAAIMLYSHLARAKGLDVGLPPTLARTEADPTRSISAA
jgi:alpha-maltose-1-phosphate synthase